MRELEFLASILISCFEFYILYDFFKDIFEFRKGSRLLHFFTIGIFVILMVCVNGLNNSIINFLIVPFLYFMVHYFLYKASFKQRICYVIIFYFIIGGIEVIVDFIISSVGSIQPSFDINDFYNRLFIILTEKLITFLIFRQIKAKYKTVGYYINQRLFYWVCVLPVVSLMIYGGIIYSEINSDMLSIPKLILVIGCFGLLFANAFVFYLFERMSQIMEKNKNIELYQMKEKMEQIHYKKLEEVNLRHRDNVHNMQHHLRAIGSLAQSKNEGEILHILEEMEVEVNAASNSIYCNNIVLNAILCERESEATRYNIEFEAYVEPNVQNGFMDDYDLITIAGNLLDNALEAARTAEETKYIGFKLFLADGGKFVMLRVENTFRHPPVIKNGIFVTSKSNKEEHGIGLKSVREKAEKHGGLLYTEIDGNLFVASVTIAVS